MVRILCETVVLAGGLSLAIALHVAAAAAADGGFSWWPLLPPLIGYGLTPLPIALCLAARSAADSIFSSDAAGATVLHWAVFTAAALLTVVLGLPIILLRAGVMDDASAGLTLGGIALAALTAALGACFARARGDESDWGGGTSLLGQ